MTPAALLVELAERVWRPLIAGGELRPVPPIGRKQAEAALEYVPALSAPSLDELRARRLRVVRRLCAIDALVDPSPNEWLLLMALNDFLQVTNPSLVGMFGRDRPERLIRATLEIVNLAGAPLTIADALSRHASFSRIFELTRVDTHVSWWVGHRTFHGEPPPARLLAWKSVRRVHEQQESIPLTSMVGTEDAWTPQWEELLSALVAASPLTDLASAARENPRFAWSGSTLALIATKPGRALAQRVLGRSGRQKDALRAVQSLPRSIQKGESPEAVRINQAVSELLGALTSKPAPYQLPSSAPEDHAREAAVVSMRRIVNVE